jgi:hypothetical protein
MEYGRLMVKVVLWKTRSERPSAFIYALFRMGELRVNARGIQLCGRIHGRTSLCVGPARPARNSDHAFSGWNVRLNFPIFISTMAVNVFHKDARGFGLLSSIMAMGTISGALLAGASRPQFGSLFAGAGVFWNGVRAGCSCAELLVVCGRAGDCRRGGADFNE